MFKMIKLIDENRNSDYVEIEKVTEMKPVKGEYGYEIMITADDKVYKSLNLYFPTETVCWSFIEHTEWTLKQNKRQIGVVFKWLCYDDDDYIAYVSVISGRTQKIAKHSEMGEKIKTNFTKGGC